MRDDRPDDALVVERPQVLERSPTPGEDRDGRRVVRSAVARRLVDPALQAPQRADDALPARRRPGPGTRRARTRASGQRRARTLQTSRQTAPVGEVTTAITRGRSGSGRLRAASNRPSCRRAAPSAARTGWRGCRTPTAGASRRTAAARPAARTRPSGRGRPPGARSAAGTRERTRSSRNQTHWSWARASLSAKYAWPAVETVTRPTSPSTHRSRSPSSARTRSRIARLTSETVLTLEPEGAAGDGGPAAASPGASIRGMRHAGRVGRAARAGHQPNPSWT